MEDITITTEYITLAAFLKFSGAVLSGGEAKERIVDGEITVNGEVCTQKGKKLYGGEIISVDDAEFKVVKSCI